MSALVCTRCGNRNAENSRFCSNCGAPLRPGAAPERASETTSTISISGLEAYDAEATGQTPMPTLSPEAQAAVDALPLGSALLVVRRGPNSGSRFLLDGELTTAGRHAQSDIFLDDVTVSRRHVEFRRQPDGSFTVADVGSLNGTYVNRERIDQVALSNGDEVQIGKYRLVFYASQRGYSPFPRLRSGETDPQGRSMLQTPSRWCRPRRRRRGQWADEHRRGAERAARRVPGHHHLQDPFPGVGGARRPAADPGRVPQVQRP
ncbi:hypothetical protein SFUMM280S_00481 [Streptomyces fumanus]